MSKTYTVAQVEKEATKERPLFIIEGSVYDVTSFLDDHPGGKKILVNMSGKDATEKFHQFHSRAILDKQASKFKVGTLEGAESASVKDDKAKASPEEEEEQEDTTYFGDLVPFGDPFWYQDWASPYYNDSHRKLRSAIRKYTDTYLTPNAFEWDKARAIPAEAYRHVAKAGILAGVAAGADGWLTEYAGDLPVPGGIKPEEYDAFHNFVLVDELCRCGSGGIMYGILGGFGIGLPPIVHFGTEEQKKKWVPPCLSGDMRVCLAITEPEGGSDVANLVTTAEKTADGKHYIVNGRKKWITGGVHSDIFVTAVRTGGKGFNGISFLVIERSKGVTTTKMDCQGVWASGTSFIEFDDVRVPVENLLGKENKGFPLIMSNFSPERVGIAIQANRFARVCLEESMKYASKRKTFGVLLRDHPVIRAKMAVMASRIESTHAWIESVVYQSTKHDPDTLSLRGGGAVALLKAHAADTFAFCSAEACQIFGGLSYTQGGQAEKVERLAREVRAYTIPGGSTEIMHDLGIRQSIKIAEIMGAKL